MSQKSFFNTLRHIVIAFKNHFQTIWIKMRWNGLIWVNFSQICFEKCLFIINSKDNYWERENAQQINYLFLQWKMFAQNNFHLFGNEFQPIPKLNLIFRNSRNIPQTIISSLNKYHLHLKMKTSDTRADLKLSIKELFPKIPYLLITIFNKRAIFQRDFISLYSLLLLKTFSLESFQNA